MEIHMEIKLAKNAGFCFGVERAVNIAEEAGAKSNVYTLGQLIHNSKEVKRLEECGVHVINSTDEVNEGDTVIVREQPEVENGEVAVVLVDGENATVKKFYKTDNMVTLVPDSNNKDYQPKFIDITKETVKVLGKVVKVIISM
jgi:4-hydroxy-3-methylbut-2-enyl diphosphate reductase IspH